MDWPKISNVGSKISFQELHDHNSLAYLDDVSNPENDIPKPIRNVPNTIHFKSNKTRQALFCRASF